MTDHHNAASTDGNDRGVEPSAIPGESRPWLVRAPERSAGLSPELARLVLDAYTVTGDVVLDVDDDVAFAEVASRTWRRHHALAGANRLATLGHAAGYIDLILLRWPSPPVQPRWLLRACRALLHTSGHLIVAVSADPSQRIATLSAISGVARTVDLQNIEHIAVLAPDPKNPPTRTERQRSAGDGTRRQGSGGDLTPSRSGLAHTDLIILGVRISSDD